MTPIQAQTLPLILDGKDILAQAKTGSGKTAAFAISLLHKLQVKTYQTQALILCPTRELETKSVKKYVSMHAQYPTPKLSPYAAVSRWHHN